jgi:hypothetical protein
MKQLMLTLALAAAVVVAVPAHAADEATGTSIGIGVGIVEPEDIESTIWVTANVRLPIADKIVVEPEVGYWKKSEEAFGVSADLEDLNFGANALYLGNSGALDFGAGAGVGLHMIKGGIGVLGVEESETESKIGFHLLGTVGYDLSEKLQVFANARYDLVSDFNQMKLYAGIRFGL